MSSLAKHPATGSGWADVGSGFRLTAAWLLFGAWLFLVFGGFAILSSPEARFPLIVGWLALALAVLIACVTMDRWVRALPALLAYGVLNGLTMIGTAHLVNDATKRIPRSTAVVMTLLAAGSTVFALGLASRKLTRVDRVGLFVVLISVLAGIANERLTLWSFGLMFCCLAAIWCIYRVRRHSRVSRSLD